MVETTRRREIEDAASSLFHERGYSATSVRDIARARRHPGRQPVRARRSKQDVLWSIVERHRRRFEVAADAVEAADPGAVVVRPGRPSRSRSFARTSASSPTTSSAPACSSTSGARSTPSAATTSRDGATPTRGGSARPSRRRRGGRLRAGRSGADGRLHPDRAQRPRRLVPAGWAPVGRDDRRRLRRPLAPRRSRRRRPRMTDPLALEPILGPLERRPARRSTTTCPTTSATRCSRRTSPAGGKVEATDWMPDEYRTAVLRFVEMHANSELMGVLPEREWLMRAPTLRRSSP